MMYQYGPCLCPRRHRQLGLPQRTCSATRQPTPSGWKYLLGYMAILRNRNHPPPSLLADALAIATMPARTASGIVCHASTTLARSGMRGANSAASAPSNRPSDVDDSSEVLDPPTGCGNWPLVLKTRDATRPSLTSGSPPTLPRPTGHGNPRQTGKCAQIHRRDCCRRAQWRYRHFGISFFAAWAAAVSGYVSSSFRNCLSAFSLRLAAR